MMRTDHMDGQTDEAFETLLKYARAGVRLTGYKRTSLTRRVRHRMEHVDVPTFEEYFDVLQANSDEFHRRRSR
jgi:two-component system CheB/CheR fusion protein